MSSRDEYVRRMQAKLEEWNAEINTLTARADKATARQKIEELQHSGESAWEDLKSGIELAGAAMGEAIDSARSRFK